MKFVRFTFPLILTSLGFLIYSNVLHGPFMFDDELFISTNYQIHNIFNLFKDFSGTRYVGFLSFAINYYFGGLNTFGYHVVNVVIHIINAMLVYFLVQLTIEIQGFKGSRVQGSFSRPMEFLTPRILAFAVSLIFLVHPIQTQAVSYITQRFTSLAALFYLLALVLYIKARLVICENCKNRFTFYILLLTSYLSAILAMKTKEISFTLPFMIIFYEFTFFRNNDLKIRTRFLYLIPFFLTLIIIPLELFSAGISSVAPELEHRLKTELTEIANKPATSNYTLTITQFNVMTTYIRLLFIPANLHFYYDYPISRSIFEAKTFFSFIFVMSVFVSAIYLYLKSRKADNAYGLLISFGILWFFITLSVVSATPLSGVIFEHWLYLPSIGFILSVVAACFHLFNRIKNKGIIIMSLFIIAAGVSLSFATYKRNIIYADLAAMLLDELKYVPNSFTTHNRLGETYLDKKMLDKAEFEFLKAVELNPVGSSISHKNLGAVYEQKGLFDKAVEEYNLAIKFSNFALGMVWGGKSVKDTIAAQSHAGLGEIYYKKGLFDDAIMEYREAIRLNPSASLYNYLGDTYIKKGLLDDAEKAFIEALKLAPNDENIRYNFEVVKKEKQKMR